MRWCLYLHISIYLSWFFQLSSLHCFLCSLFSPDQAGNSYLLEPVLLSLHQARPHYLWQTETHTKPKCSLCHRAVTSPLPCWREMSGKNSGMTEKPSDLLQVKLYSSTHLISWRTHHFQLVTKHRSWSKPQKSLKCTTIDFRGFLSTAKQGTGSGSVYPCVPIQVWLREQQGAGMKPGFFFPFGNLTEPWTLLQNSVNLFQKVRK